MGGALEQGKEAQTLAASEKKLKQLNLKTLMYTFMERMRNKVFMYNMIYEYSLIKLSAVNTKSHLNSSC